MRAPRPWFDPEPLVSALNRIPDRAWTAPVVDDVNPGYQTVGLVVAGRRNPMAELFGFVLATYAPIWAAWLSRVPPGGRIGPHRDAGPYRERWHVPIVPAGTMNGRTATAGVPFRVEHWRPHSITNPTDHPRIHLVIDRQVIVNNDTTPFQRC